MRDRVGVGAFADDPRAMFRQHVEDRDVSEIHCIVENIMLITGLSIPINNISGVLYWSLHSIVYYLLPIFVNTNYITHLIL